MASYGIEAVLGLDEGDEPFRLLRAAEQNLIEVLRLFATQPGVHFSDDERGVRFLNLHAPPESMILRPSSTAAARVDDDAELERVGLAVDWIVFPSRAARELREALLRAHLVEGRSRWMLADLDALPARPATPEGFQVERVESPQAMADWIDASARGFGYSELTKRRYFCAYTQAPSSAGNIERRLHHVGYSGQRAVASATVVLAAGIAGVYDVLTEPDRRRLGFGATVLRCALEEARRHGYRSAALMSSPLGESVYRRAGFSLEFDVPEYRWTARAASP